MRTIDTKERLILAAFELFSEYGYERTSVDQIAKAVGIKAPSIYAHFKGKEEILKAVNEWVDEKYNKGMRKGMFTADDIRTGAELKACAMESVKFTIDSEMIRKMRKFVTLEQYRNEFFSECATKYQITNHIEIYTPIFKHLMDAGIMIKGNPEILALEFIAPVTLMIQRYDREPDKKDEILKMIEEHMDVFISNHFQGL